MHRRRPLYLSVLTIPLLSLILIPQSAAAQSIDCSALYSRYVQAANLLLGASDSGNESPYMRSTRQSASTILARRAPGHRWREAGGGGRALRPEPRLPDECSAGTRQRPVMAVASDVLPKNGCVYVVRRASEGVRPAALIAG